MGERESLLFEKIFGDKIPNIKDLSLNDGIRIPGESITKYFDNGVALLMNESAFPNRRINELMTLFWDLVGNKIVPIALSPAVKSVSFWCEKKGPQEIAVVFVPLNFIDLLQRTMVMQLGALVFIASQVRDFYNQRFYNGEEMKRRALAHEAEFLLSAKQVFSEFAPNEYQRTVLALFPKGLESLPAELRYESIPFVPPQAQRDGKM